MREIFELIIKYIPEEERKPAQEENTYEIGK
jgi:hypothetical protein